MMKFQIIQREGNRKGFKDDLGLNKWMLEVRNSQGQYRENREEEEDLLTIGNGSV